MPKKIAAVAELKGLFLSENGNNRITGQHGVIPFSLSQLGDIIKNAGKKVKVKKIKNLLLLLVIIF